MERTKKINKEVTEKKQTQETKRKNNKNKDTHTDDKKRVKFSRSIYLSIYLSKYLSIIHISEYISDKKNKKVDYLTFPSV